MMITSFSWAGSGTLTSVIGTESEGPGWCMFMNVIILSAAGMMVISSPDSTEKALSRTEVMGGGGGLFSGGGLGLPNSSSVSL